MRKDRSGFLSVYLAELLAAALLIASTLVAAAERYAAFQEDRDELRRMNLAEVTAIRFVKDSYRQYAEQDASFAVCGCEVEIRYEEMTARITITGDFMTRRRTLTFDDIGDAVKEYR